MQRRHRLTNIPTEIVRTVTTIADQGSLSKAAEKLSLSQPAISTQLKKIEHLVGGPLFERTAAGIKATVRGDLVIAQARKMLDANDQILSLGGAAKDSRIVRVGLTKKFASRFLSLCTQENAWRHGLTVTCDQSEELKKLMIEGYLDVATLINCRDNRFKTVAEWEEPLSWIRSRQFVVSPGTPLPLIGFPGDFSTMASIRALESRNLSYRMVFSSPDIHARLEAVSASVGLSAFGTRFVAAPIVEAVEYYLPPLENMGISLCIRRGLDESAIRSILKVLIKLAPPKVATEPALLPTQDKDVA